MKRGFGVGTRELSFEEGLEAAMCESKMKVIFESGGNCSSIVVDEL